MKRAIIALLCLSAGLARSQPSNMVHRYSFAAAANDSIGTAHGVLQSGALVSGGALMLDGVNDYVDLPNDLVLGYTAITIETWVTDDGSAAWSRIYDFGNSLGGEDVSGAGTQYIFLSLPAGGGILRSAYTIGGGEQQVDASRPAAGQKVHLVWTSDGAMQEGRLYVDGVQVGINPGMTLTPNDLGSTVNNWLGRSQFNDPYFRGAIDEFRIYNVALSPAEVLSSFQAGPNRLFTGPVYFMTQPQSRIIVEGQTATFSADVDGTPPFSFQWFRNSSPVAGATNVTLSFASALADSNAVFRLWATNVFTNVTFIAASSNAVLTVLADTNPPVLLRAQSLSTTGVEVLFSEPIRTNTATNKANYTLTGPGGSVTINSAALDNAGTLVTLGTPSLVPGSNYTLTVSNLRDRSVASNAIAPGCQKTFVATIYLVRDIGLPAIAGAIVPSSNSFGFTAAGAGIGGASDQFTFASELRSGDFDLQLRLGALGLSDAWASAGLMARDGFNSNAMFAASLATPGQAGSFFQSRDVAGGTAAQTDSFPVNYPNTWLRLKRSGDVFTGYASLDGGNWALLGSVTITAPVALQVGIAVSSHNAAQSTFASVANTGNVTNTAIANVPLPFEPPGPSTRRTGLVISEIMYHPQNPTTNSLEFVEIYNSDLIAEDLSGYRLSSSIDYVFPQGTILPAGGYLAIARNPSTVQAYYGISGVLGPFTNNLPNDNGTVRLRNELDSVLLEVNYGSKAPWPVSPDGGGHSLVLRRPSFGENDPRAWAASDVVGGSPGRAEGYGAEPLRGVMFNEILAHTDLPEVDSIELFNSGSQPVNLLGCVLTDDADTNKFTIGNVTIPARGFVAFTETQLGFALDAAGETIFLKNPGKTRVLDAVRFDAQENGVSFGRHPNGSDRWSRLATKTFGSANSAPRISLIGFNEIMYHPLSGDDELQYVELHNRGSSATNISGWKLKDGVSFTFKTNTVIPAGGYLVIAENLSRLLTNYPTLNTNNTVGNFSGNLAHNGERLALTMPDTLITTNGSVVTTNSIDIVVDEVTYQDGGRWGQWSDGGGSSLELIDPRSDRRDAANWGDSIETNKAPWTLIERTALTGLGMGNGTSGNGAPNRLEFFLQGPGECLVDEVECRSNGGANQVTNPGFEPGTNGWAFQGTHAATSLEVGQAFSGSRSLHVRATERGDTGANRIRTAIPLMPVGGANQATLRARVRWLRGDPNILLRLRGNWMECAGVMTVPGNLGTPGAANSRFAANVGPAISGVTHFPVLPAASEDIVVSARVADADGVASVVLRYRIDPDLNFIDGLMLDNGTVGDAFANDGIYSATIPGRPAGTLVAFHVQAQDSRFPPVAAYFPNDAPVRECLVNFGETLRSGSIGSYRLWLTQANLDYWANREKNSNKGIDATFVYGNWRVVHNAETLYSGSPWHTPGYSGPLGNTCNYDVHFPKDDRLLGAADFTLQSQTVGESSVFNNDITAQAEMTAQWMGREIGLRSNHRRYVFVSLNGQDRAMIYYDAQQPNGDLMEEFFPDDPDGHLHKIEDWFEFDDAGSGQSQITARLLNYTLDGQKSAARYRWTFRPRAVKGSPNDFADLFALADAVATNTPGPEPYTSGALNLMNVSQWMHVFALQHTAGNWDSYGYRRGKNMYTYKPEEGRWELLLWDVQLVLGKSSDGPQQYLFDLGSPYAADQYEPMIARMYSHPPFVREFWGALDRLVNGPMLPANYNPLMDARYAALRANDVPVQDPAGIKGWIDARRAYILTQLPQAAFSLSGPGSFSSSSNCITLTGTAPVGAGSIVINGASYPLTWTSVTNWSARVTLTNAGANALTVQALDRNGNVLSNGTAIVTVTYTGTVVPPEGNVVFNEVMHQPAAEGAEYVELFNTHSNFTFNLANWRINGLDHAFPPGSILPPRGFLVLAEDPYTFATVYGGTNAPFAQFDGSLDVDGETLTLLRPGSGTNEVVVDRVRYEANAPWPAATNGVALQLVDTAQDNSRAGNWNTGSTNAPPPPSTLTLIDYPSAWKYNQTSNLDAANWKATNYNDAAWPSGAGLLAFENNGVINSLIQTTLNNPRVATNGMKSGHAYYFRRAFNLTNTLADYTVTAGAYVDDGAVFYVNGAGVPTRVRMPGGTVTNGSLASDAPPNDSDATVPDTFTIPASLFVVGTNVVAAEVHQVATNSSDIVFGMRMEADFTGVPPVSSGPFTPGVKNSATAMLPAFPAVWLNEAQADNQSGITDNFGEREPWIELYNAGTNAVNLGGLYLSTNYASLMLWACPSNTINPGQFLVIWADGQSAQTSGTNLHTSFRLGGTSGSIALSRLVNAQPQIVDYLNYASVPANQSYGDVPDGQPFYRDIMYFASPRQSNSLALPPITIYINEWMADNTSASGIADPADGHYEDWFEFYNPTLSAVNLGGYSLTDNLADKFQYQVPNNGHYIVPAMGYLLVWADNETGQNNTNRADLHANFALSKNGDAIGLFAPDGTQIDAVVFGAQTNDMSQGRYPDGTGPLCFMPAPTPRVANVIPPPPVPPQFSSISVADGTASFTFSITTGKLYRVEYNNDLATGSWTPLGSDQTATSSPITIHNAVGTNRQQFYRIVQLD